ncbi:[FeFe] hydrogenase, group A [Lutispora thermophila]|uniref:NADH-quinone oxidoreductase subunit G n=1 Tax=Lutispora thermophila DSM 19022 TaxID=1122184 RepID=A0A1M6EGI1_9FIRM|nr:[FeFe] hydrogenase, group A [Lutispora thermophila]SHI84574.1 NADH-quinone oxidoreductase subunit G [Lutispora thermophila DSM 19022]
MGNKEYMIIDGIPVEINGEKNLLELIRKVGIKLPTFCYHSELSVYGACRMCMVETERGSLEAACSTPPRAGMEIKTNTERLRKYRKNILELLLANHCRDCTTCNNNGKCKLQDLAMRFNIQNVRFPNTAAEPKVDDSSPSITRDTNKCILCGDCVRMCNEIQNVGAIDFAHRGSKMTISTSFDAPIAQSPCVGCGQCAVVCPTGAIVVKDNTAEVWKALDDKNTKVTVQIAPAVRVGLGKELGLSDGENAMGKIVAALRRMGFDEIYDTSTGADLTVLEESNELLKRLEEGKQDMPLFTSCCPAWVRYCEKNYPELLPHVSTCRSPMQMFAAIIKEESKNSSRKAVHVAVMPCTAKKFEATRDEFKVNGIPNVDYVITTQELIQMIKESGIVFSELEPESIDMPFGTMTGAGVIFGVTGGVTEAVLRRIASDKSNTGLMSIAYKGVRGMEGVKETTIMYGDREVRIAIVSGLKNASDLIERIKEGEHYDFVEVMACPGGCINGGGQPFVPYEARVMRGKGLYSADKLCNIKRSEENPLMMSLYNGILKGRVHELLHVEYASKNQEG